MVGQSRRDALLRSKRLRRSQPGIGGIPTRDGVVVGGADEACPLDSQTVAAAVAALAAEHDIGSATHVAALVALRRILSTGGKCMLLRQRRCSSNGSRKF